MPKKKGSGKKKMGSPGDKSSTNAKKVDTTPPTKTRERQISTSAIESTRSLIASLPKDDPRWNALSKYIFDVAGGTQEIARLPKSVSTECNNNKNTSGNVEKPLSSSTSTSCTKTNSSTNETSSSATSNKKDGDISNSYKNNDTKDGRKDSSSDKKATNLPEDNTWDDDEKVVTFDESRTACINLFNYGISLSILDRLVDFAAGSKLSHPRDAFSIVELLATAALENYESAAAIAARSDSATAARLRKFRQIVPTQTMKGRSYSGESSEGQPFDEIDEDEDEQEEFIHSASFLSGFFSSHDGDGSQMIFSSRGAPSEQRLFRAEQDEMSGLYRHVSGLIAPGRRLSVASSNASSTTTTTAMSIDTANPIYSSKRWPMVGDNVIAKYYGGHERLNGRYCEAHVIGNNGDDTFIVQWKDGDDDGSIVCGDPSMDTMKVRFPQSKPRIARMHSYIMRRAIPSNEMTMLTKLIGDGADINHVDSLGNTPLTLAIACASTYDLIKYLLDAGADIESKGPLGTPLEMVIDCGANNLELLSLLLNHGADTDSVVLEDIKFQPMKDLIIRFQTMKLKDLAQELIVKNSKFLIKDDIEVMESDLDIVVKTGSKRLRDKKDQDVKTAGSSTPFTTSAVQEKYEISESMRDKFAFKLLNNLFDCVPVLMKTKSTNIHIIHRVLKLIRYCLSMYPKTARNPDDSKVVSVFNFVERYRDSTDITLLIGGLATIGELISRFPHFYYHASWYGTKDIAKYLGKESHVSKNHWELKYIDANQCSNIAANVVRQISSAKSKINGAFLRLNGGSINKGRIPKGSKRKRGKRGNSSTDGSNKSSSVAGLTDTEKSLQKFAVKVKEMFRLHEKRLENVVEVCQHLKYGKFDMFVLLLQGKLIDGKSDLPLSINIFEDKNVSDTLLECVKINDGIEKLMAAIVSDSTAFNNFVALLRNTAIRPTDLKILYYRKGSGSRVSLKNITTGLDLSLRRSQKCPRQTVDDLLYYSPNRMDMMVVQPLLRMNIFERRVLAILRIRDPRYQLYCKRLVGCTIFGGGALVSGTKAKHLYVKSYNKIDGTHLITTPDQNPRHMKLCMCDYKIVKEGENVSLQMNDEKNDESKDDEEENNKDSEDCAKSAAEGSATLMPGDRIVARYRNSNRYYKGVVSEIWDVDNTVTVHFDDGDIDRVPFSHVRTMPKDTIKPNSAVEVLTSESVIHNRNSNSNSSAPSHSLTIDELINERVFSGHRNRPRWSPGRVLAVCGDGMIEVRVHTSTGSHHLSVSRSMIRVPVTSSNSPLKCGTRVLVRGSARVSGLLYGSKWSNGRFKLGTVIGYQKNDKGQFMYTVVEEEGGEIIKNVKSHELKVSTNSRLRRFGSSSHGQRDDDVVIAEVSQAFPSLDMGRTGKPGRINPKEIMEREAAQSRIQNQIAPAKSDESVRPPQYLSDGSNAPFICSICTYINEDGGKACSMCNAPAPLPKEVHNKISTISKGNNTTNDNDETNNEKTVKNIKFNSMDKDIEKAKKISDSNNITPEVESKISLTVPQIFIKWHIDPAMPSSNISSSDRYYHSSGSKLQTPPPKRPVISRGAIKRTKDFDFRSSNPTIFQALSAMNGALASSTSSFMSVARSNSVQVEKVAPWGSGEACNVCYNVILDFGNGPEILADTRSLQDEIARLENMDYKELQRLAKSEGVKANQKRDKLLSKLKSQLESSFEEEKKDSGAYFSSNNVMTEKSTDTNSSKDTSSYLSLKKTMMDDEEVEPIKIQSKTDLLLSKIQAQIKSHGEDIFSGSTVNAMFLLKLILESDYDRYKDVVRSDKLGHIVNMQLKKPLVVSGNDLPAWCNSIIEAAPFLLPIAVRRQWLGCTSLGASRTIAWLQKHNTHLSSARAAVSEAERAHNVAIANNNEIQQVQAVQLAAQAADRLHEAEMKHHVGALRCDIVKVRHDDDHLLEDGLFLMNVHAQSANKLEVQFIGENGFGDGVTQGFFSGLAKILQTRSVNKKVPMWAVDTNESEGMLVNKYGLMPKPLPPKSTDDLEMSKTRAKILERFKFLGRLMGKAHLDGYIVPLPLTTEFFSLVKGERLPPTSIKLFEGKTGFMSGLLDVVKAMNNEEDGPGFAPEMYFNMTGNELCNIFGEDFFTKCHSLSGRKEYTSIKQWLSRMDLRFVDPTLAASVKIKVFQDKSKIAQLRKEVFAAQKKGNITLVRTLMRKIQQQAKLETKHKIVEISTQNERKMNDNAKSNRVKRMRDEFENQGSTDTNNENDISSSSSSSSSSSKKKRPKKTSEISNVTSAAKQAPDELFPGGAKQLVQATKESLNLYVDLITKRWLQSGIKEQIEAFRDGLKDIMPLSKLSSFSANELRSMFCGEPVVAWDLNTLTDEILVPTPEMQESNEFQLLIKELVRMNNRDRARFLEFVTAIPRLTPGLAINVSFSMPGSGNLPTARTCTYDLYIPHYRSSKELRYGLKIAVANGLEAGFHEGEAATSMSEFFLSPQPSPTIAPSNTSNLGMEINSLPMLPPSRTASSSSSSSSQQQEFSLSRNNSISTGTSITTTNTANNGSNTTTEVLQDGCELPGFSVKFDVSDVGAQLLVYWSGPNVMTPRWFHGVVNHFTEEKGHYVIYPEDSDMQWHDLRTTRYRLLKRAVPVK